MIVAVKTTGYGGKFKHAIIGIGNTLWVVFGIPVTPNHFLAFRIGQNFHRAAKHCSSEKTVVTEIDARFIVKQELTYTH